MAVRTLSGTDVLMRERDARGAANQPALEAVLVLDADGGVVTASASARSLFGADVRTDRELEALLEGELRDVLAGVEGLRSVPLRLRDAVPERWLEIGVHTLGVHGAGAGDLGRGQRTVVARDVTAEVRVRLLRQAFGSVVSHELRTPVTTIYGGAQLVADPNVSANTRDQAAAAIASEAERLYRVVEDLAVLARFDQPLVTVDEPVLLQRFVRGIVEHEARRVDGHVRLLLPDDLPAVAGRQGYVEQVLRHLLTSAIRFSSRTEMVEVTAARVRDAVDVVVTDLGPALDPAEAPVLFDLFHRSTRTLADASGANISLFVCRRLVEAMGGEIWARPRQPLGAEIGFRLRVAVEAG